ncbi:hypothetical protein TrVE_jg2066 [Triparma verrucosa]|uniref:6-phosphofructo-2-kinase domain-containing protein n=1 Tax=Triparma verrucosa TaxID=1606542 RepID=A0A9W7C4P1_9STRA|nr:hypothetical protein TrVE_jg2066 [Triparma verrucosa]
MSSPPPTPPPTSPTRIGGHYPGASSPSPKVGGTEGGNASGFKVDNPMPHILCEGNNAQPLDIIGATATDKLVLIMVGLPATGKTHTSKRIQRFLEFFHDIPCQIFNVGEYRRKICGINMPASFYDNDNKEGKRQRAEACDVALADLVNYMGLAGVRVGILDATNSTRERREYVKKVIREKKLGVKVMCIESICNDEELLAENIRTVKLNTPDYKDQPPELAMLDFLQRRENYKKHYESVTDLDGPHVIIHDCKKFIINRIRGYLPLKVVHFVMNLHTLPRTFFFTRHGQSEYNTRGKIGGDSGLSPNGMEYARRLGKWAKERVCVVDGKEVPARLWTSTLRRTKETAQFIDHPTIEAKFDDGFQHDWIQMRPMARRNLDELYAGSCDGMTYKEIEDVFPEEFKARQSDKLAYRYPRGESYMDVILRLEPLAHEMERTREPIMIIGHQGILRILYAYFMGLKREDAPYVSIPLNHVLKLNPHAYGCKEERTCLLSKMEMVADGQDEPITSMPVKANMKRVGSKNRIEELLREGGKGQGGEIGASPSWGPDDPVMNAPSC